MYHRNELFSNLKEEEIPPTLSACTLTEKEEYTEFEADRFREARELVGQGKSYKQVAAHFRQLDRKNKQQNGENEVENPESTLNISELLALASTQCGTRIPFKEAGQILEACGLPDADQYTSESGDRFLDACDLIKKQNKTLKEVAEHFGVDSSSIESSQLVEQMSDAADEMESNIAAITDTVMQQRAEAQALSDTQQYMKHYVQAVKQGQAVQDFWAKLRSHARDSISGKQQARLIRAEPITESTPLSSVKLINSSENSENGTNTD